MSETIEAMVANAKKRAAEQGHDAVIYDNHHGNWGTGSLTQTPERYRNSEVSYYNNRIVFNANVSAVEMVNVVNQMAYQVPIAPEDCMFLQFHCPGDSLRLSRRMAEVWQRIPQACRHELRHHWQTDFLHHAGGPDIKYVSWQSMVKGRMAAWTTRCGHEIVFRGLIVDKMPDSVCDSLIANEFATALLMSRTPSSARHTFSADDAWELMGEWGFDPVHYLAWEDEHKSKLKKWEKEADGAMALDIG